MLVMRSSAMRSCVFSLSEEEMMEAGVMPCDKQRRRHRERGGVTEEVDEKEVKGSLCDTNVTTEKHRHI